MHIKISETMLEKVISHPKQVYTFLGLTAATLHIVPFSHYYLENKKLEENDKQRHHEIEENDKQRHHEIEIKKHEIEIEKKKIEENDKQRYHEIVIEKKKIEENEKQRHHEIEINKLEIELKNLDGGFNFFNL